MVAPLYLSVWLSVCPSFCQSVRMEQLGSHWTDFHEIWFGFRRRSVEKIQVSLNCGKTLYEHLCICMIISRPILLKMRNVSDISYRENQNTHFVFNNFLTRNFLSSILCITIQWLQFESTKAHNFIKVTISQHTTFYVLRPSLTLVREHTVVQITCLKF